MKKIHKQKRSIAIASLLALSAALAAYLFIPTVNISPASGEPDVALGNPLEIHSSPLSRITKIAVYANDQLLGMEYNLESSDLVRDFGLKPGQEVRVEAKVTSLMGVTREFISSFNTVTPVTVDSMMVDSAPYTAGQKIPPQSTLAFAFNKSLTHAAVSLDGSDAIELQIDAEDPSSATLPPTVSLKQGESHVFRLMATATDSAVMEPRDLRVNVVKPLSLYGKVEESGGEVRIELDANSPFADPESVRAALETTVPDPRISVEKQKIFIISSAVAAGQDYTIRLSRAEGADGSFLEAPLTMTVSYRADPSAAVSSSGSGYRGYVYTSGGSTAAAGSSGGGSAADSGPPPGWPSCCPWPPA